MMAEVKDIKKEDMDNPKTAETIGKMGEAEFTKELAKPVATTNQEMIAAWERGDMELHNKLLHIGWLKNRNKKG